MTTSNDYTRPDGVDDATVEAAGKMSEALEWIERARGDIYEFHQKLGRADELFAEAAKQLRDAGQTSLAGMVEREVSGRNVLQGRWTFQIVDEFDETYYDVVKAAEKQVRDELLEGKKHIYESELKEKTRTHGQSGHESRPNEGESS